MPASCHPGCNALHVQIRVSEDYISEVDLVPGFGGPTHQVDRLVARQRRLEGKAFPRSQKLIEFPKNEPARSDRHTLRVQGIEAARRDIGINECGRQDQVPSKSRT